MDQESCNNVVATGQIVTQTQRKKKIVLTRIESFSACHRLHSPHLTDEENEMLYGKCNSRNGHGHNYRLEVSLTGDVDPITGMIMNLTDLKTLIQDSVLHHLDHKNIDLDVAHFRDSSLVSTAENIADFIFDQLHRSIDELGGNVQLQSVTLYETDKNVVRVIAD